MNQAEISPFIGKCVSVSLTNGQSFKGFLRVIDDAFQIDAGGSQTSIDAPEDISEIELLTM